MPRKKLRKIPNLHPLDLEIPLPVLENEQQDTLTMSQRSRAYIRHSDARHTYLKDLADQTALTLTDLYELAIDTFIYERLGILPPPRHLHNQRNPKPAHHILERIPRKKPKPKPQTESRSREIAKKKVLKHP